MEKLHTQKGFTLLEMLIVVAIIAILISIAMPVFMGSMMEVRQEADNANLRGAYAEAMVSYMMDDISGMDTAVSAGAMKADANSTQVANINVAEKTWQTGDTVAVYIDALGTPHIIVTPEG